MLALARIMCADITAKMALPFWLKLALRERRKKLKPAHPHLRMAGAGAPDISQVPPADVPAALQGGIDDGEVRALPHPTQVGDGELYHH